MTPVYAIGGVTLRLELKSSAAEESVRALLEPFRASDAKAEWVLEAELSDRFATRLRPEQQVLPTAHRTETGAVVLGPNFELTLSTGRRRALLIGALARFPLETAIKMVLAEALSLTGGVLIHGVGLSEQGRGHLFTGPSGAGKSTLGQAAVKHGIQRLADELVAITPSAREGYSLHGTPWNVGAPGEFPLVTVGMLGWATTAKMEDASAVDLLRLLIPNSLAMDPTPEGRAARFRSLSALVHQVLTRKLWFAPDSDLGVVLAQG